MNRRQAKKAFKKKYGVNPGEAINIFSNAVEAINNINWSEIFEKIGEMALKAKEIGERALELKEAESNGKASESNNDNPNPS